MTIIITAHGFYADYINAANRASFYGINGHNVHSAKGYIAARTVVEKHLADNNINWDSYYIIGAKTISENGRDRRADITVKVDLAA